ncbi:MAG: sugar phosphate isomerase/epimerase [Candidatus Solibacter usitatus]|nr:sugar phosphate isomerase/epimerase [Candidatus Solibacter usitatus]
MHTFSRRTLFTTALAAAAAPLKQPIGFQVYPIREALAKDFDGALRHMASLGYRTVEMCSPPGYASSGFGPLATIKAADMRARIQAAGLTCQSCHYGFRELRESLDERIGFAKELGLSQMVLASFGLKPDAPLSDWSRAAEELNQIAARIGKAGLQAGFHNHHGEFKEIDGVLIYDHLMKTFHPKLVKMQFQVAVVSIGYHAADYMKKYPGRFISLHLADWSAAGKKGVPVGQGDVDWKKLFAAAKKGGVKNYYVEMNMEAMTASAAYLRDL